MKDVLVKKALRITDDLENALDYMQELKNMDCITTIIVKYGSNNYVLALNAVKELTEDCRRQLRPMLVEGDVNSF